MYSRQVASIYGNGIVRGPRPGKWGFHIASADERKLRAQIGRSSVKVKRHVATLTAAERKKFRCT